MNARSEGKWDRSAMQSAWDRASKAYLERRGHDVGAVSYGNLAPSEDSMGLLGDLRGKRVLDIGCGGGQNAVACALAGAEVTGIDFSVAQLMAARTLADEHGVSIDWRSGDGSTLYASSKSLDSSFDLVLAIQILPYMDDPAMMLRNSSAIIRPGGKLIASIDHPLRNCFYDADSEEMAPYPIRNYFDGEPLLWNFESELPMQAYHHPLGVWIAWIIAAGLTLQQVLEAGAPLEVCDELWPLDSALAPLRNIPQTAILVANRAL